MKIIGLTGGIASGKSLVGDMLASWGAVVVDADKLAREVVEPGEPAYRAIVERFGAGVLREDGTLDRTALGRIVFSDAAARGDLERIVHPAIAQLAARRFERERQRGTPLLFYVVPLLFETGMTARFDEVWLVYVDGETQVERLMKRDGIDRAEALRKIGAQLPLAEKLARSQVVIDNSGDPGATEKLVRKEWELLAQAGADG
jgi:dephospho-CoA kinase